MQFAINNATRFSPTGFTYTGHLDPYDGLLTTAEGKRAPDALVEAFRRLGLPLRGSDVADVHELDLETLEGALVREAARVAAAEIAHRAYWADYVSECQARVDDLDRKRSDYEQTTVPLKRAAAEAAVAAIAAGVTEGDEVPDHLARLVEAVRAAAEELPEVSAWEHQCRKILSDARSLAQTAAFKPYLDEHSDRAGSMIPNALKLIGYIVSDRKAKRATELEKLRAQIRHLGVEV